MTSPTQPTTQAAPEGSADTPVRPDAHSKTTFAQSLLATLRQHHPRSVHGEVGDAYAKGYRLAVSELCDTIAAAFPTSERWAAGILPADLLPTHRIGEHIAATRLHCGLIP